MVGDLRFRNITRSHAGTYLHLESAVWPAADVVLWRRDGDGKAVAARLVQHVPCKDGGILHHSLSPLSAMQAQHGSNRAAKQTPAIREPDMTMLLSTALSPCIRDKAAAN